MYLPDENFGSVFVLPASYLGGRVSIINPRQPLLKYLWAVKKAYRH